MKLVPYDLDTKRFWLLTQQVEINSSSYWRSQRELFLAQRCA
ncbi:MAG: hypothetical protein AAFQ14_02540 [Cyanobacteria bacterium J06621_12]